MNVTQIMNSTKCIYDRIQDEESRFIYTNRLLYNMTDDYLYIKRIIDRLPESKIVREKLNNHEKQPKILFGAGTWGKRFLYTFSDIKWKCFVDNSLVGKEMAGLPVLSLEEAVFLYPDAYYVVTTRFFHDEIEKQLFSSGISEENVFKFVDLMENLFGTQYFDLPYLVHDKDEVFIDAGGFDGASTLDFVKWSSGDYKKIYTFEPNASMIELCKSNLRKLKDCSILNEGCWNVPGFIDFVEDEQKEMGSHFIDGGDSITSSNRIKVNMIDKVLGNERATFLKMDIEGAELRAIMGAEAQIKKYKPKCAISIYHKPEDIVEIPKLLLEYRSDYKFYLRQYSLTIAELILYAV